MSISNPQFHHAQLHEPKALTILIVDDVQENLDLLQDMLADKGHTSILARGGSEAFEFLQREPIHLIIADAMMPRMDGFQFCKKVKENPQHAKIPFIIYTGNYVDEEDKELARRVGVDKYVMKYAGLGSLMEAVNELVLERYGYNLDGMVETPDHIDDQSFLSEHHTIVTKKLEEKMKELKMYVTTLARRNRELQVSENQYRGLFDNASVSIFVIDSESKRIMDVNRQGIALLGYSKSELLEMPGLPFVSRDGYPKTQNSFAQLFQRGEVVTQEMSMKTNIGEVIDADISAGPVLQPNDTRIMLFVRDITEQKITRDKLMQMGKMSLMGRLAAGIAHEIRNPLAGITLNLQYLHRKIDQTSPDFESIAAALEGAERIQHVIEDTLGLARVAPPILQEHSINSIVSHALSFLTILLQHKNISLTTAYDENAPTVMVDQKQIQQVILNVVENAIDVSPEGSSISVATRTISSKDATHQYSNVEVAIQDCGTGIPPEVKTHLFEPFRTTKPGGTGLGLALSKYIISRHQGDILIESAPGGGTIVRIIVPMSSSINGVDE
jgi:two-component system sensor histidine kinase AtoS